MKFQQSLNFDALLRAIALLFCNVLHHCCIVTILGEAILFCTFTLAKGNIQPLVSDNLVILNVIFCLCNPYSTSLPNFTRHKSERLHSLQCQIIYPREQLFTIFELETMGFAKSEVSEHSLHLRNIALWVKPLVTCGHVCVCVRVCVRTLCAKWAAVTPLTASGSWFVFLRL